MSSRGWRQPLGASPFPPGRTSDGAGLWRKTGYSILEGGGVLSTPPLRGPVSPEITINCDAGVWPTARAAIGDFPRAAAAIWLGRGRQPRSDDCPSRKEEIFYGGGVSWGKIILDPISGVREMRRGMAQTGNRGLAVGAVVKRPWIQVCQVWPGGTRNQHRQREARAGEVGGRPGCEGPQRSPRLTGTATHSHLAPARRKCIGQAPLGLSTDDGRKPA